MLAEWGLTPEYIINNWTEELLNLMTRKLAERKGLSSQTDAGKPDKVRTAPGKNKVSIESLVASSNGAIEVKHGN